jgi:Fe2+ or Zn2+ uptake regulation protein
VLTSARAYARRVALGHESDSPDADQAGSAESIEAIVEILREKGQRVTTPRRLLITSLLQAGGHRSAEELAAEVQAQAPDVHISTIYRNLEELQRLGVIEHVHLGHGAATYHLAGISHGHLVCSNCGSILEVPDDVFRSLARDVDKHYGFEIDPHHFAMVGFCVSCRNLVERD